MILFDGKKISGEILSGIKKEIAKKKLKLTLAAILVGDSSVSKIYIRRKERACYDAGIGFKLFKFSADISSEILKRKISEIVKNPVNSGVIVQLPLPKSFDTQGILNLIPPEKDVDVLSETSIGKFSQGTSLVLPPVVNGIFHFFKEYKIKTQGKNILIIGAGRLVGYPLAIWLLRQNATVAVLNKYSKDVMSFTRKAEILISGVGKSNLIRGNMVKKGVVVIDAGTSVESGKLAGDINFKEVSKKASYITPVPGGVGPMTVACLLENLVKLSDKK